jgi:hypothetical protein
MNIEIRDERENGHYAAYLDGKRLGYATWVKVHDTVVLPHTEVDSEWGGRGIGSMLARRAFEDARADGLTVLPFCPFMKRWAELHPDFRDVVRAARPGELPSIESAVRAARTLESLAQSAQAPHSSNDRSAASATADTQAATSATETRTETQTDTQTEAETEAETES